MKEEKEGNKENVEQDKGSKSLKEETGAATDNLENDKSKKSHWVRNCLIIFVILLIFFILGVTVIGCFGFSLLRNWDSGYGNFEVPKFGSNQSDDSKIDKMLDELDKKVYGDKTAQPTATKTSSSVRPTSTQSATTQSATNTPQPSATTQVAPTSTIDPMANFINFFTDLSTKDAYGHVAGISRWNKPVVNIKIIEGEPDSVQSRCLNEVIADFNSQSSSVKMQMSTNEEDDIRIFYVPDDEVQRLHSQNHDVDGFHESTLADDGCSRLEGRVIISSTDNIVDAYKCYVMKHEMYHAMGFWGHSDYYQESIMAVPHETYTFSEVDKKAIRFMYNSGLPLCAREQAVRDYYASHSDI